MFEVQLELHGGRSSALQMPCRFAGWLPGLRAGNEQVASQVEIERQQRRIRISSHARHPFVRRQRRGILLFAQIKPDPAKETLMIEHAGAAQLLVGKMPVRLSPVSLLMPEPMSMAGPAPPHSSCSRLPCR
jgi:hypothetical protein